MSLENLVMEYSNMFFKICMVILCNEQDVLQDTLCRCIEKTVDFRDKEHEKAWLNKVATNQCHDIHRQRIRHPQANIEEITASCEIWQHSRRIIQNYILLQLRHICGGRTGGQGKTAGCKRQAACKQPLKYIELAEERKNDLIILGKGDKITPEKVAGW